MAPHKFQVSSTLHYINYEMIPQESQKAPRTWKAFSSCCLVASSSCLMAVMSWRSLVFSACDSSHNFRMLSNIFGGCQQKLIRATPATRSKHDDGKSDISRSLMVNTGLTEVMFGGGGGGSVSSGGGGCWPRLSSLAARAWAWAWFLMVVDASWLINVWSIQTQTHLSSGGAISTVSTISSL